MNLRKNKSGIFLFNIIPIYRPGMTKVFDYSRHQFGAATLPSTAQRIKQNSFYSGMEGLCGDCLEELDFCYTFATDGDRDYAKINWKSPGDFQCVEVGGPITHLQNIGFEGNLSVAQYLDTQWNALTHGVNYTRNNAGAFCYINNHPTMGTIVHGAQMGNSPFSNTFLTPVGGGLPPSTEGLHQHNMNSSGGQNVGTVPVDGEGFYEQARFDVNTIRLTRNGSSFADFTTASVAFSGTRSVYALAYHNTGSATNRSDAQIGFLAYGSSLSHEPSGTFYSIWNNYFVSL